MGGHQQALATVRRPLIYAGIIALLAILPMAVLEGRPGASSTPWLWHTPRPSWPP